MCEFISLQQGEKCWKEKAGGKEHKILEGGESSTWWSTGFNPSPDRLVRLFADGADWEPGGGIGLFLINLK